MQTNTTLFFRKHLGNTASKWRYGALALAFSTFGLVSAQTTVFTESMGSVGGSTVSISAHEAANGFDNDLYTMTGTADVRNTSPSSGYSGASGLANIFITNTAGRFFQIEGINTSSYGPMELSFGISKSTTTATGSDLVLEVSTDGVIYTPVSYPALPTGSGTATWFYRTTATGSIPAAANLRIRFRATGSTTQYRIDDVKLVATAGCSNPTINPSGSVSICQGNSVTLTSSPGVSYLWSTGATTQSISVNTSGNYTVTVTAANGCVTTSAPTTVTVKPLPSNVVNASGPLTFCEGGSVVLTAAESGASYSWSNGSNNQSITVSNSGTFSVTVTENGCSATSSPITVTENDNPEPEITLLGDPIFCEGGSVQMTTGSYASYLWSNGAATQTTAATAAGSYTVTVTDANSCSGTSDAVTVYTRALPIISAGNDVAICAGGSADLHAAVIANDLFISEYVEGSGNNKYIEIYNGTGATVNLGDYRLRTYSNGNSVPNFDNLLSGTLAPGQTVVYKNASASIYSGTATSLSSMVFNGNDAVVLYRVSTGSNVDIFGRIGDDPGVEWTNGSASTLNSTLRRDASIYSGVTMNPTGTGPGAFITLGDWNEFATDDVSGLGSHTISGTFSWSPATGLNTTSGADVTASPSETTTYTVTGTFACSNTDQVTVIVNPNPLVTASATAIACNGGTAEVTVSADGGTAPYSGTGTFTVTAGTYTYTVSDANGCSGSATITVTEPEALTASSSATAIACNGGTAEVTVSADGGTAPYSGTGTFTVTAGTYTYTVTDANGCSASTTITVTEPEALTASSSATAIACNGGTAEVTVYADGGTAPYSGTGTFTVTAGTYTYTATDANGCSASITITVTEPEALTASSSATAIACNGGTAEVTVSADGGTAPYSGTGTFTVTAGTYTYTVTDANGCSASTTITVTEPEALTASSSATAIACNGGTAEVTVSANGGTAPYSGTGTFTVTAGTYTYTVTDANGCTATTTITVGEPSALTASIGAIPASGINTCAFGTDANIVIGYGSVSSATLNGSASGGTGSYSYSWSPAAGLSNPSSANPVFTPSMASGCNVYNFTLTVTDANGCTATAAVSVNVVNVLSPSSNPKAKKVMICHRTNGSNGSVTLEVSENAVAAHLAHGDCLGSCQSACGVKSDTPIVFATEESEATETHEELHVYPNPTEGKFTVEMHDVDADSPVELRVYDMAGKLVHSQSALPVNNEVEMDVDMTAKTHQTGLYVVKITNGERQFIQKMNFIK
ncbi:MAG: type sorting protein [Crocinitomicaceae bacterium]|jgi:hypothetical protein|nr:type sorting protein [Crocinitomicaceae bacterium]